MKQLNIIKNFWENVVRNINCSTPTRMQMKSMNVERGNETLFGSTHLRAYFFISVFLVARPGQIFVPGRRKKFFCPLPC